MTSVLANKNGKGKRFGSMPLYKKHNLVMQSFFPAVI